MGLSRPQPRVAERSAGGDNEVERDGNGRPRIWITCTKCGGSGQVPSEKVAGRLNQCPTCKLEGRVKRSFTRVTTYIDVLEDKESIMAWSGRMVLMGCALDTGFLKDVSSMDVSADKAVLNRRAEAAKELAGANKKSEHGTLLHAYSEIVDEHGWEGLPEDIEAEDFLHAMGYADATQPFLRIVHMEQLVVNDEIGTAGTPDRVSSIRPGVVLVAPDGHVFSEDELIITDLKTGRVDFGALKMAMQLAIYARSSLYNKETGERTPLENVNTEWGLIMHAPADGTTCDLYWADLTMGWEAVQVAGLVRSMRSRSSKALQMVKDLTVGG